MMKEIKAIETEYRGYKFRSRLEARWAVFFNWFGIKWEYEKEGYELSTGERYLPDFYLPVENVYVEVKGVEPDEKYKDLLAHFATEIGKDILIVVGILGEGKTLLFRAHEEYWSDFCLIIDPIPLQEKRMILFEHDGTLSDKKAFEFYFKEYKEMIEETRKFSIDAMKQARFEFNS